MDGVGNTAVRSRTQSILSKDKTRLSILLGFDASALHLQGGFAMVDSVNSARFSHVLILAGSLLVTLSTGCASGPMAIHSCTREIERTNCSSDGCTSSVQIVTGQPNQLIDGAGWVLGIPRKIILWDRRVDNHKVGPDTVSAVATFVEATQMSDVCVRVNQYAPVDEWKRLTKNDRVSPGWRYTMGTLSLVGYTLLPGRLFGGDEYNPYTNSVYVYSDVPALGMEAAAYAKDVQSRQYPGTYAAANSLPIVSVWHETINTDDTLAYLEANGNSEQFEEGVRVLYPNYGASVGGSFDSAMGISPVLTVGGAIVGHATGWQQRTSRYSTQSAYTTWLESYDVGNEPSIRLVSGK